MLVNRLKYLLQTAPYQEIVRDPEYRMWKLLEVYQQYKQFPLDNIRQQLENLLPELSRRGKFSFKQFLARYENENNPLHYYFLLIGKVAAYIDYQSYNKILWNEYDPPRILVRSRFDMRQWVLHFVKLSLGKLSLQEQNTYINSIGYIEDFHHQLPIMSVKHRQLIAQNVLQIKYHPDTFAAEIKNWFRNKLAYEVANPENEALLIGQLLYDKGIIPFWKTEGAADEAVADEADACSLLVDNIGIQASLNTILYGPPGTGKTYHTIARAVQIANPEFDVSSASRAELRAEYTRLCNEGQIEFVTFHQSMSYEDFIEGIKPMEPNEEDATVKYEIKDGIFKRLAKRASLVPTTKSTSLAISEDEFQRAGFYKISLGDTSNPDDDQIYDWCIKNGYIALGWGDANDFTGVTESDLNRMRQTNTIERFACQALKNFIHLIRPGDYVVVTYGNLQFRAIGKVTGQYEFKNVEGLPVHQFRKTEWLVKDIRLPYEEIYNKQFSQQSIYRLDKKEIRKEFFVKKESGKLDDSKPKNYVLIIDEINRGNVSQIFGELITLIEEDKRSGREEALTIRLPYSKQSFSVPPNLYLIGTMNTADRSVEALDTALRRRFTFEEMMPRPELLSPSRMVWNLWWQYPDSGWDDEPYLQKEEALFDLIGYPEKENTKEKKEQLWAPMKRQGRRDESQINILEGLAFTGVNLQRVLTKINERLMVLCNQDHQIGHAFFLNVDSREKLYQVFYQKVIPQLKEYFYGDFGKIGLVLGKHFVKMKNNNIEFADFAYEEKELLLERKVYEINTFKGDDGIDYNAFIEAVKAID